MRHLPVVGALLPLSTSGCRNPYLFEDAQATICPLPAQVTARAYQYIYQYIFISICIYVSALCLPSACSLCENEVRAGCLPSLHVCPGDFCCCCCCCCCCCFHCLPARGLPATVLMCLSLVTHESIEPARRGDSLPSLARRAHHPHARRPRLRTGMLCYVMVPLLPPRSQPARPGGAFSHCLSGALSVNISITLSPRYHKYE
jgi:hypothetical protein